MWIHHISCIHSSVDGHLSCFHLLAVVTMGVQVSLQVPAFTPFGVYPGLDLLLRSSLRHPLQAWDAAEKSGSKTCETSPNLKVSVPTYMAFCNVEWWLFPPFAIAKWVVPGKREAWQGSALTVVLSSLKIPECPYHWLDVCWFAWIDRGGEVKKSMACKAVKR